MMTIEEYRIVFDQWRDSVVEYEASVDGLIALAEARGQGDRALPLIVRESDTELLAAVRREIRAKAGVAETRRRLDALKVTRAE